MFQGPISDPFIGNTEKVLHLRRVRQNLKDDGLSGKGKAPGKGSGCAMAEIISMQDDDGLPSSMGIFLQLCL